MRLTNPMIYTFRLVIPSIDVLNFYEGKVDAVSVVTEQGQRLQFPFYYLKPFVSQSGISGRFRVMIDSSNKISRIERIS